MKKISKIVLFAFVVLSVFVLFTSCQDAFVTPVAYTRFDSDSGQYVYYSSYVYQDQLKVWSSEAYSQEQYATEDLVFTFGKCCGADNLGDYRYLLVDTTACYFTVYIKTGIYDSSKSIYLNGTALVPDNTYVSEYSTALTFNNPAFIRTNPGGAVDSSKVNVLEYR